MLHPPQAETEQHPTSSRQPPLWLSLVPVVFLVGALWVCLVHFKSLELSTHIPLVLATAVASLVGLGLGQKWKDLEQGMVQGISMSLSSILILLTIGPLVATWIQAGIVPAMVAYGLDLLSPKVFLPAAALICGFVSLATGSSWSTAATVGIALMGVGEGLGMPQAIVGGAVISGAYFGDKMSPLSDTTNLAPAVAGAELFDHIRHMAWTTGPSFLIALIGFTFLGLGHEGHTNADSVNAIATSIREQFAVHPALLFPLLLVIGMVILRIPALPALLSGMVLGAIVAIAVQGESLGQVLASAYSGVKLDSGNPIVDELLSAGGLESMFSTVVLIICALAFGGVMERAGMLATIARAILQLARGTGGLVAATVFSCIGMNVLASDQYLAIVVPGRMYKSAYDARGLAPQNLSRALEDSATLTSALIPWNTCGAFMIATLGLAPWTYVPYCLLNLINPLLSILYGFTGLTMRPKAAEQTP